MGRRSLRAAAAAGRECRAIRGSRMVRTRACRATTPVGLGRAASVIDVSLLRNPEMSPATPGDSARVLVVDLNNFARYPTLAIGVLVAVLRRAGMAVEVFSPLSCGVSGFAREARPGRFGLVRDRLSYRSAVSTNPVVKQARAWLAARHGSKLARETGPVAAAFAERLRTSRPDAV